MLMTARECIRSNRGQALVEFAIILPVLLLLITGMVDFGIVLNEYITVTHAAREAARVAAVGNNDAAVIMAAKNAASTIDKGQLTVSVTPASRSSGTSVTVIVSNPIKIITPMASAFFPSGFSVQGASVMRME